MAAESIAQDVCTHPPHRTYAWYAADGTFCAGCCDCGKVLAGAAPDPAEAREERLAPKRAEVASLELALHQLRGTGGRQRERIEVWLQGARVALAIAEREGTDMATTYVGTFEDEDRTAVLCDDCTGAALEAGEELPDDPITADFDGVAQFRCARCGRSLLAVAGLGA